MPVKPFHGEVNSQPEPMELMDYHEVMMNAPIGVFVSSVQGCFIDANHSLADLYGYESPEELIESISDIATQIYVTPTDRQIFMRQMEEHGKVVNYECRRRRRNGTIFWVSLHAGCICDDNGIITHYRGFTTDITVRKEAEEALEKRMMTLIQPLDFDQDLTFDDLFTLKEIQRLQDEFALATGVASIITDTDGTPITSPSNFCRLCSDIVRQTEKGRDNCLHSDATIGCACSERPTIHHCLSAGLLDAGAGIFVGGRHIANWLIGQVRDESQNEEHILAYASEIGVDSQKLLEAYREVPAMSRARFEDIGKMLITLAGQLSASAYQNIQQARFIAERRRTMQKLRERETRIESIFRSAPIGIGVVVSRRFTKVNQRFCDITGYNSTELIDQDSMIIYFDKQEYDLVGQQKYDQINRRGTGTMETRWRRKDGTVIEVLLSSTPIDFDDFSKGVTFTAMDITDRKQSEQALKESEVKLVAYANQMEQFSLSAASMISLKDEKIVFKKISKAIVDYSDFRRVLISLFKEEEPYRRIIGHGGVSEDTVKKLSKIPLPKSRYDNVFSQGIRLGRFSYYIPHSMKNILNQEATVFGKGPPPLDDSAWHPEDNLFVRLKDDKDELIGIISVDESKSGKQPTLETVRPLEIYASFIAQIIRFKREQKKRERLEEQFRMAQKMESIGRLAGGVAHDFNNMLGVILGYAEMALMERDQPAHAALRGIEQAARRSANLTRQLLAFARKQTIAPEVLNFNVVIEGMLNMLRRLIGEDIELIWLPGEDLDKIKMDPTQIDQILANLCVNSRDAILGDGGKVIIETGNAILDEDYCARHPGAVPGGYVLLTVSDNGCGMNADTISHLFEPFFTTKETGKGTGLGLATIYGIVKQNSGFIKASSVENQGTTFKIYLPRHKAEIEPPVHADTMGPIKLLHKTILLVEDEPMMLEMTQTMLEGLGYLVLSVAAPGEALRLAEENGDGINLLVTDVVMPEMNGRDLAAKLAAVIPDLKCLFMSGYTADVIGHHGVLDKGVHFIQKPFTRQELLAGIEEALKADYE